MAYLFWHPYFEHFYNRRVVVYSFSHSRFPQTFSIELRVKYNGSCSPLTVGSERLEEVLSPRMGKPLIRLHLHTVAPRVVEDRPARRSDSYHYSKISVFSCNMEKTYKNL